MNYRQRLKIIIITFGIFSCLIGCKEGADTQNLRDYKFKVGQIWKYDNRPGEEGSTIKILKIEKYEKSGIIIHVFVDGLKIKNPNSPTGFSDEITHLPLSENAFTKSITRISSLNVIITESMEGYWSWKEAYENDTGAVFDIPVREAVRYVEETLGNGSIPIKLKKQNN